MRLLLRLNKLLADGGWIKHIPANSNLHGRLTFNSLRAHKGPPEAANNSVNVV